MSTPRKLLLLLSSAVLIAVALGALRLQVAFEPEDLITSASQSAPEEIVSFAQHQGANEALLLVQGPDVLSDAGLRFQYALERRVALVEYVRDTVSLGTIPVPHIPPETNLGLEDLESELDNADQDSALQFTLQTLVDTAPERFPLGTADILERTGGALRYAAIFQNEEPSAAEIATLRATIDHAPSLERAFVSASHDVAIIRVNLRQRLAIQEQTEVMHNLDAALAGVEVPAGFRVRLAGLPHLKVSVGTELGRDHIQLIALAILANLFVLAIGFRSAPSALLPLAAAGLSLAAVLGAMGWLGVPLDLLTTIVPPLLITVVVSDAIHFITRYREELADHPPEVAGRTALQRVGAACFVTSVTTAIGFASLTLADTVALRRFGLAAALAVLAGYGITMGLLALALPRHERRQQGPPIAQRVRSSLSSLARWSVEHPWTTVSISALALAIAVVVGAGVRTDSAMLDQFAPSHPLRQTAEVLDNSLGGIRQMDVLVRAPDSSLLEPAPNLEIERLVSWLRDQPNVRMVRTHLEPVGEVWHRISGGPANEAWQERRRMEALLSLVNDESNESLVRRWLSGDHSMARIEIGLSDAPTQHYLELATRTRERISSSPLHWEVGGEAWRAAAGLQSLSGDLLRSLLAAVFLVFLTLSFLFRDVRLGLLSLPPNLLPLAFVLAWMTLRDIPLHASSVMVFAVAFGLVVDGTIHMVARYREERQQSGGAGQGAIAMVEHTGRAVVLANTTLLLGFCVLFLSSFTPIREFAELSLVAIVASLAAEVFLLPALLSLFAAQRT